MKKRFYLLLLCLMAVFCTSVQSWAVVRYVKPTSSGTADGSTWANASGNLQSIINASTTGDEVWVAAGTYKPTSTADRTISFAMKNGVAIYGGFPNTGNPTLTDRNLTANPTILSGDIGTVGDNADNSYHVINNPSGLNNTAILDGFVITGGNSAISLNDGIRSYGGGVFNDLCSPTFRNCAFQQNTALRGGAMYNGGGSPVLTNCSFQQNTADDGGAMYNDGSIYLSTSSPVLTNCTFLQNTAAGRGGAMYNNGYSGTSSPVLTNCSFQQNTAAFRGGAMYNDTDTLIGTSRPVLTNCVLFGNGGNNTFYENGQSRTTATYSLFDNTVTGYTGSNNLTTTTNPFVSTTSMALAPCSPAINAGNPATTSATVGNTDLAGQPRFFASGQIDMGAIEYQGSPPTASISLASTSVCAGQSITLTATTGLSSYSWSSSGGTFTSTTNLATFSSTTSGGYSFTVTATNTNSCTATATASVTVNALPTVSISTASSSLCAGATLNLTATAGLSTYSWSSSGGTFTSTTNEARLTNPASGGYSFTVTATNTNSCTATATASVMVNVNPSPTRLYVNATATGANTGLTWADAFTTLQAALNYTCSANLTEIWVAKGTYYPTTTTDRTISFAMKNGVAIYGGFAGSELSNYNLSLRNFVTNKTTLSGDLLGDDGANFANNADNSYHVINNPSGLTNTAILDGFVITGGNGPYYGGGVYNNGSGLGKICNPTFRNCAFQQNTASYGGAMFNDGQFGTSNPVLTNCTFQQNTASQYGGAMFNNGGDNGISNPVLTNCTFLQNTALLGGAMFNQGEDNGTSIPVLTNCVLFGNGGDNTFLNNSTTGPTATYSLFDNTVTGYSGSNNLTTTTNPFVSTTSMALSPCSPAINAGNPATTSATVGNTDLVGQPRFFDSGQIDMGAIEYQGSPPTASISLASTSVCAGQSITLTATTGLSSYSWSSSGGTFTSTTNLATFSSTTSGGYSFTVTATNTNSCTATATASVTVNALPTVSISTASSSLCAGATLNLTATAGLSTYSWSSSGGTFTSTTNEARLTNPASGGYSFTVTATNTNSCTATATASVTVNTLPTVVISSASQVCIGATLNLSATAGLSSYSWSNPGGTFSSNAATATFSSSSTGGFSFTVTAGNGTCTNTATASVTINTLPTASISLTSTPVCAGQSITLTATTGLSSYSWSSSGGTFTSTTNLATLSNPTSGGYSFTVTATNSNGCTATATASVTVNANPTVSITPASSSLCIGATLDLTASEPVSGSAGLAPPTTAVVDNYAWASSAGGTFNSNLATATFSSTSAGGFSFTVTVTNTNSCTATATASVTVNALPTVVISSASQVCIGATLNLSATAGLSSYSWANSGGTFSSNAASATFSSSSTGGFSFTVTAGNGTCTNTATASVTVNALPTASISLTSTPVCAGQSITLTATAGLSTYSWSSSGGTFTSTTNQATLSNPTSGGYSFTVTATNSNGCTATATASVTVKANPTVSISPASSSLCIGAILDLTASEPVSGSAGLAPPTTAVVDNYAWASSAGGTFNSNLATATFSSTSAGGFSFTVTVTNTNSCTATASASVTVNANPTAGINPSATSICAGGSINLSGTGGSNYSWATSSGGSFTSSTGSPTWSTTNSSGTYSITVTAGDGSCTATAMTTVQINTNPTAGINPSATSICAGGTINLTGTGGSNYSWSASSGNFTSSTGSPTSWRTTSNSGTYSITVTAGDGTCTATASVSVTINSLPTLSISPTSSQICVGQSLTLSASSGLVGYSWSKSGGSFTGSINQPQISFSGTLGGYTLTVTASNGTCSNSATASVSVAANPSIIIQASNPQPCVGEVITLSATTGMSTYSWNKSGGSFSGSTNQPQISYSHSQTGNYSISVTGVNAASCSATGSVIIQIKSKPTASISPSSTQSICVGQALSLTASGGSPYSWSGPSFNSTNAIASLNTSSTSNSGVYQVMVGTGVCTATATVSVQINANPIPNPSSNSSICTGETLRLSSNGGASSYSWAANEYTSNEQNPTRTNASTAMSGVYSITVANSSGCTATASISVVVYAAPNLMASSNSPLCEGKTLQLSASGGTNYSWAASGFSSSQQNPSRANATPSMSGIYKVTALNGSCSITSTATISVQVNPSFTVSVSFAPICIQGNPLNLSVSGGDKYRWRGPNDFSSTSATPTKGKTVANGEGIYSVTVTGNGVCTATSTIRVFYGIGAGGISITNRSPYCKGGPISLTATAAGASSYQWTKQFGTVNFTGNPVTISNNAKTSDGGVYIVFVTGQNGCIEKQETLVTVSPVACIGTRLATEEAEDIDMQINAYPNPVSNTLTVEVTLQKPSKLSLKLFNSIGKESGTWQLNEEATFHKTELNMRELTGGIYLLQAQAGKQKVVKRVVKIQY